jgi:hypothetical protein
VLAGPRSRDRLLIVERIRRGDQDHVDIRTLQHLLITGQRVGGVVLRGEGVGAGLVATDHRDQPAASVGIDSRRHPIIRDTARTDNPPTERHCQRVATLIDRSSNRIAEHGIKWPPTTMRVTARCRAT